MTHVWILECGAIGQPPFARTVHATLEAALERSKNDYWATEQPVPYGGCTHLQVIDQKQHKWITLDRYAVE